MGEVVIFALGIATLYCFWRCLYMLAQWWSWFDMKDAEHEQWRMDRYG